MKHRVQFGLIVLFLAASLCGALRAPQPVDAQQTLRDVTINYIEASRISNVRSEVRAYVSVTDLDGAPVKGLGEDEFTVIEDGVDIEAFDVERAVEGLWVVLLMDTTTSMGPEGLGAAKTAADRFVTSMASGDQVALYEFQEEPLLLVDFSHDHNKVRNAITKLELVDKWTCLYDAGDAAVEKAMEITKGRRAVVLLTDGRDDRNGQPCSTVTVDDLITRAWTQRVPLYVIGLGRAIDEPVLKRIAEKTGGAYWSAPQPEDLQAAYNQIAELLQSQYLVTYESQAAAGDHAVVIRVDYQGQQQLDAREVIIPPFPLSITPTRATPGAVVTPGAATAEPSPTAAEEPDTGLSLGNAIYLLPIAAVAIVIALFAWSRLRKREPEPFGEGIPPLEPLDLGEGLGDAETADTEETRYIPPVEEEVTREVPEAEFAQPLAKLTVMSSLQLPEGEAYELYGRSVYIGRGADNDVVVPDQPVSRAHAELRYQGGQFHVYDRGSRFGTRVNGATVPPQGMQLNDGDQLQLGTRTTLRFTRLRVLGGGEMDGTRDVGLEDETSDVGPDETSAFGA